MFGYFEVFAVALILVLIGAESVAVVWVLYAALFGSAVPPGYDGPSMVGAMFLILIVRRFIRAGKVNSE